MPRARVGSVFQSPKDGHWIVQLTMPSGKRSSRIHLPLGTSEAMAREKALVWSEKAARGEIYFEQPKATRTPPVPHEETLGGWAERWFEARKNRGFDTRPDVSRWGKWIGARWGTRPMKSIERTEIEDFVTHLDAEVIAGRLAWKSALNVWGLVTKAFDDATNAKDRSLRILTSNPAIDLRGPDRGAHKSKEHLRPAELLAVVSCERAPLLHRRIVAVAAYLYVRPGELGALEWTDVDLESRTFTVHQALDRDDALKSTKTDQPRLVPIEPALLPLLLAMRAEVGGQGRVFPVIPDEEHLARWFRSLLKLAGVVRAALHDGTATRRAVTFYDLRATGITWRLIRGDEPFHVMHDAGHRRFETTQGYDRSARVLRGSYGEVFPPLPVSLLSRIAQERVESRKLPESAGKLWRRWELKAPPSVLSGRFARFCRARRVGSWLSNRRKCATPGEPVALPVALRRRLGAASWGSVAHPSMVVQGVREGQPSPALLDVARGLAGLAAFDVLEVELERLGGTA